MKFDMKIMCLMISIHDNCFGINFIHTFQPIRTFIQIIRLPPFIIQKVHWCSIFIQTFHPFNNFHPCTYFFIQHNYFGINFIHTFQLVESFIQIICVLTFIIQKVQWSTFIQTFHPFCDFHPCTYGKIFPTSFLHGMGILYEYFVPIIKMFQIYSFLLTGSWL